ncbi:MAG: ribonuclease M5 [Eubacteriales bacterium]
MSKIDIIRPDEICIGEVIVVEGRDDETAVKNAVKASTIATHGFHINRKTWQQIQNAYETRGIIVFTDPDFAGLQIRKRIKERCPLAKEAFLAKKDALKSGDIGIENASPQAIREALSKVRYTKKVFIQTFTQADLLENGLSGGEGAKSKREKLGKALGIGYANTQSFLKKLNEYGITKEEFEKKLKEI